MSMLYAVKDPSAILDYTIDWTQPALVGDRISQALAAGDTIVASTWTPTLANGSSDTGVTVSAPALTATTTTLRLAGGMVGDPTHMIVNHITTTQGRQDDQTLYLDIFQK